MTPEYELAMKTIREATRKYSAVCKSYRDGGIGDDEFLAARAEYMEAEKIFDAAYANREHTETI